jgi:hypothetical protein
MDDYTPFDTLSVYLKGTEVSVPFFQPFMVFGCTNGATSFTASSAVI